MKEPPICDKCGEYQDACACTESEPPVVGSATGYAAPADIVSVRAAKIADEIFAICADQTPGELTQHQLVSAVIARELRKQHNAELSHAANNKKERT